MGEGAVVLLSGGQDSTTCLAWAARHKAFSEVVALSFDYGQRHRVELDAAAIIARKAGVEHVVLRVEFPPVSALNSDKPVAVDGGLHGLPSTFLPGRNAAFISLAASLAVARGLNNVVTGVCQTDFSGYPDCRADFVDALQRALRLGLAAPSLKVHTPLMHLNKRDTVLLAKKLDAFEWLADSHTCYNGARPPCGTCPACIIRARGFEQAGVPDPAVK